MDSDELNAIKAAGLQSGGNAGGQDGESQEQQETKRANEEQMRRDLIATVLESAARERLARIRLVKPALAAQIESILLRSAQTGQIRGRVSEAQLIGLLEQADESFAKTGSGAVKKGAIVYQRRRDIDDDDDF